MIIANNLCKQYSIKKLCKEIIAIDNISFHVDEGTIVGLIGMSGSGKTTLIKLISGLLTPSKGLIYTMGKRADDLGKKEKLNLSVQLSNISLLDFERSVLENLSMLQIIYQLPNHEFKIEKEKLLHKLNILELQKCIVKDLSLGERMRVEFAAAIITNPKVLLLDEPTIGLDAVAKGYIKEILLEKQQKGMTIIIASHNLEEISSLCSKILFLDQGKIIFTGKERELRKKYASIDEMVLTFDGRMPNVDDLPVMKYSLNNNELSLMYDSNIVRASEVLKHFMNSNISEVKMKKKTLEDVVRKILEREVGYE